MFWDAGEDGDALERLQSERQEWRAMLNNLQGSFALKDMELAISLAECALSSTSESALVKASS